MTDIDIKNSQPTVIRWICHRYKIICPYLDMYVKDRENILKNNGIHKLDIISALNSSHLRKRALHGRGDGLRAPIYRPQQEQSRSWQGQTSNPNGPWPLAP